MTDYINLKYFVISFALGLLVVYAMAPPNRIVYKFPSPDNADSVIYKNESDSCYRYEAKETSCTTNAVDQPIVAS
jgi:hypothetical protein